MFRGWLGAGAEWRSQNWDEEAIENAQGGEGDGLRQQGEGWLGVEHGEKDGGGEEEAGGEGLGHGERGEVNQQQPDEECSGEEQVTAEECGRQGGKEQGDEGGCDGGGEGEGEAMNAVEAVGGLGCMKGGWRESAGVEEPGVKQSIGGIDEPDGEEEGEGQDGG